ncbi:MAG: AAA family ATPase [Bacteroidota bacterium]
MPQDELYGADLGTPPWEILNQTLAAAGFGYTVVPPDSNALSAPYRVTFRAPDGSGPIRFEELSSGERSVVGLVASLYSGTQGGPLPELFLLDEPDAHLHPSLTQTFISTLYEQIAQKLGVRVVITTHSPSTVALAPEGSVYEVRREGRKMFADRVENKWDVVGKLTSGFVTVAPGTRNVLVEDDDDAQFHDGVLEALLNHGLSPVPAGRLAFIPASIETGNGGCTEVAKVVRAANTGPLQDFSTVWGLVDLDAGDEEPENKQELLDHDRIVKLGRYSIENYWVDPVMVAVVSLRKDDSQPLPGMEPFVGKQAEIQNATSEDLQHIADHVLGAMRDALNTPPTEDEEQREPVPYVTGQKIQLPKWLLHRKGKTLKGPATSLPYFDCVIRRIVSAYNVVPLIPQELADTYARLAGVDPQPSA